MPCMTPPWLWPSTISGLMTVPKSLTMVYFTTSTLPVSGSISTSATCAPLGKAAGAAARDQQVAVALDQLDPVERHAELLGQHLGERRPVALAVIERAGDDGDVAVRLEADATHLLHRRRGHFEIVADADSTQPAA